MAKWNNRRKHRIIPRNKTDENSYKRIQLSRFLKREMLITAITILIVTITAIGGSYAILSNIQKAEDYNVVKAGTLQIAYDDSSDGLGNIIRLNGAYPESDEEGKKREPYRFRITNTGSLNTEYKVKILDDTSMIEEDGCQDKLLDKSKIKYNINQGEAIILSTVAEEYNIISGNLGAGESVIYEIRMWIDENAGNEVLGTHYHGKIVVEAVQQQQMLTGKASDVIFNAENIGSKGAIDTSDEEQTFITGEEPNNYVWYSGKLWRAVSKDTSDNSVKLVTQWNISAISYSSGNSAFGSSYAKEWLNNTSADGFLGNLREPEKFIKMDSVWNTTSSSGTTKPAKTTLVDSPIGLLNIYEYEKSYQTTTAINGYLNNGLTWITLTEASGSNIYGILSNNRITMVGTTTRYGLRPTINLNANIEIESGEGSENNPYRLKGDNDSSTFLNERYSGEYVHFGDGENNLYRIVSIESNNAKITSAEPLKQNGKFYYKNFRTSSSGSIYYSPADSNFVAAYWLNNDYLNPINGYLTEIQVSMIESKDWYLGTVALGENYRLSKYTTETGNTLTSNVINTKVGLLRIGEQLSAQNQRHIKKGTTSSKTGLVYEYWLLTPYNASDMNIVDEGGVITNSFVINAEGIKPSLYLKSTIKITGGDGTKENPFTISE